MTKTPDFSLVIIAWDQRRGGILECSYPPISISENTAMNIYNMHRMTGTEPGFGNMRMKLESGKTYNILSLFTGYGRSTSPDGFTGNYGENIYGVAERVFCLFLPQDLKPDFYEEILVKIASRIIVNFDNREVIVKKIGKFVEKSGRLRSAEALYDYLDEELDKYLKIAEDKLVRVLKTEIAGLHILLKEKYEHIKELTINPAKTAYYQDRRKIAETHEQQKKIGELIRQVKLLSAKAEMTEAISKEKDEIIEQMKADYYKIFDTLTDQILQLENEIKGITESTQALVKDLNKALAEKISKISELEEIIRKYRSKYGDIE